MKPLLVIVADKDMRELFRGLFMRDDFPEQLGCRNVEIEERDIISPPGEKDPGLFTRAEALARPFLKSHEHLLLVLDSKWQGSPGTKKIKDNLGSRLEKNGWQKDRFAVLVIDPELEGWLWSDRRALHKAMCA